MTTLVPGGTAQFKPKPEPEPVPGSENITLVAPFDIPAQGIKQGDFFQVTLERFREQAQQLSAAGFIPKGEDLARLQEIEKERIASESPGTAAAVGGLRGATLGLSDPLFEAGGADPADIERLRAQNPNISLLSEAGGSLATLGAGGGARLGLKTAQAAKTLPTAQLAGKGLRLALKNKGKLGPLITGAAAAKLLGGD